VERGSDRRGLREDGGAERDCVVVRGGHGVAGVFTATDALQALADIVRRATA
jgi:hypothetical protein